MKIYHYLLAVSLLLTATSCRKTPVTPVTPDKIDTPTFKNIVIIGNSITHTDPQPGTEWQCSCGMAATAPDSDYVHHLTKYFQQLYPGAVITVGSSYAWELTYDSGYDVPGNFNSFRNLHPDLVILRLGEDVIQTPLDTADFGIHYRQLLAEFTQTGTTVLAVGSIWIRPVTDQVMRNNTPNFITLANLNNLAGVFAYGLFTDPGIQSHPDNFGHRMIADTIWKKVQQLRTKLIK